MMSAKHPRVQSTINEREVLKAAPLIQTGGERRRERERGVRFMGQVHGYLLGFLSGLKPQHS